MQNGTLTAASCICGSSSPVVAITKENNNSLQKNEESPEIPPDLAYNSL